MNKNVYHLMKGATLADLKTQNNDMFPFLTTDLLTKKANQQIKFKRIKSIINHKNINEVLPAKFNKNEVEDYYSFVFFGRSNVGKSSLLNSLIGLDIAPMSKQPGKTKDLLLCQLKTFKKAYLVDAPGYGFATGVSKYEIKQWGKMIRTYLMRSKSLNQKILCLLDSSHGLTETDALVFEMLRDLKKNFQIIFTKCDKMKGGGRQKSLESIMALRQKYDMMNFYVNFTSCRSGEGINELRNYLLFSMIGEQYL